MILATLCCIKCAGCTLMVHRNKTVNDWYVFVFTATDFSGELIDSPEGRLEWIPEEKILELNLWESDQVFMPWIRDGKILLRKI